MAVRVVRAMLIITLHLFLFSLVIVVIFLYFLRNVTVYAKDTSAVDEDLGEDVEDRVVDFARRWHQQGNKGEDDADGEKDDGCPSFDGCRACRSRFHCSKRGDFSITGADPSFDKTWRFEKS